MTRICDLIFPNSKRVFNRVCFITGLAAVIMFFMAEKAFAGSPVATLSLSSDRVIIGDSRIARLSRADYGGMSFVASPGGRYSTDDKYTIQSARYGLTRSPVKKGELSRRAYMHHYIKDTLRTSGRCKVILVASVNECRNKYIGTRQYEVLAHRSIVRLACELRRIYVKKGNAVLHPVVMIVGCPPVDESRAHTRKNRNIKAYNRRVKNLAGRKGIIYRRMRDPEKEDYADGVHFKRGKGGYNDYMHNFLMKM